MHTVSLIQFSPTLSVSDIFSCCFFSDWWGFHGGKEEGRAGQGGAGTALLHKEMVAGITCYIYICNEKRREKNLREFEH